MTATTIALLGTLVVGFALARALLADTPMDPRRRLLWTAAWSPAIGFGALSLAVFAWRCAGMAKPTGSGLAAAAAFVLAATRSRRPPPEEAMREPRPGRLPAPLGWLAWAALALTVTDGARGFAALTHHEPLGSWDAVAVWNVRADMLDRGWDRYPQLLAAVDRSSHPNYPLGLPATVAGLRMAAGEDTGDAPRLVAATWSASLLLLLFLCVETVAAPEVAALATSWVSVTPLAVYWAAAQVADVPVAVLFLGAVVGLASQLPGWNGVRLPTALSGICLGLLAWTKNEGLAMAAITCAGFVLAHRLAQRRGSETRRGLMMPLLVGALPGLVATLVFKLFWSPGSGLETYLQGSWGSRLVDSHRWWLPARELAIRLLAPTSQSWWSLVWWVPAVALLLGLVLGAGRRPCFAFGTGVLVAVTASWLPIYAATPYPLEWHVASSLDRLLLQTLPTTLAIGAAALANGSLGGPTGEARAEER